MKRKQLLTRGFFKENPIFVFLLGMCPALAVTSTFETSLGMGVLVIFVLTCSNIVISLVKGFIPEQIKIPSFIVIIATFVTLVAMFTEAYAFELYESLGVFIPLIVVNCLILGRAEAFASKNSVADSAIDGFGMGVGFTIGLSIIGIVRELLATGQIAYGVYLPLGEPGFLFNLNWFIGGDFNIADYGISVFALPAGAFITLGFLLAMKNILESKRGEA
ncbi:electron transport complex subunit E [Mycoplasmatota bacterium]|nr:electron transport complex subunit E [Mycoplasmatota bacterium]